jgi:hypothetical protein
LKLRRTPTEPAPLVTYHVLRITASQLPDFAKGRICSARLHLATQIANLRYIFTELHGTGVYSSTVCPGFIAQEGMWARLNRKVHPAFGLSAPERVATAVVEAIRHTKVEVIVNPLPVRPVILL